MIERIRKSSMKVLVAGGFGFVGSEFVKQLENNSIDYVSVDKKDHAAKKRTIFLDLCDRQKTTELIEKFKPDVFVHCGTNSALAYRDHFLESFREDAHALTNIIESLPKIPDCRLIYFSSSYYLVGTQQ